MKVLIACEFSGIVRDAFARRGHDAWSCDLLPTESSGNHIQDDVLRHLNKGWDLMIAHPPCTYLAISGIGWMSHPDDKHLPADKRRPHPRYPNRKQDQEKALHFVLDLVSAPIDRLCIENPVGQLSSLWRKPDQIIQPYYFGDTASKPTCFWLKNLPLLRYGTDVQMALGESTPPQTEIVDKGEFAVTSKGKAGAKWNWWLPPSKDRWRIRSRTFPGIAAAMAEQWGQDIEVVTQQ